MTTQFEPTEVQKQVLVTKVEELYKDDLTRWPKGTTPTYSYEKDKTGTKTAAVKFHIGQMTLSADFKLVGDCSWTRTGDWRD